MVHVKLQYNRIYFVGRYKTAMLITCNPLYGYSVELKFTKSYKSTLTISFFFKCVLMLRERSRIIQQIKTVE